MLQNCLAKQVHVDSNQSGWGTVGRRPRRKQLAAVADGDISRPTFGTLLMLPPLRTCLLPPTLGRTLFCVSAWTHLTPPMHRGL